MMAVRTPEEKAAFVITRWAKRILEKKNNLRFERSELDNSQIEMGSKLIISDMKEREPSLDLSQSVESVENVMLN